MLFDGQLVRPSSFNELESATLHLGKKRGRHMSAKHRWTSADLEKLPDDEWIHYEIIDGELFTSEHPHIYHQLVRGEISVALRTWNEIANLGDAVFGPGVVLDSYNEVVPDVIWISNSRLESALQPDGYLHETPELVIEVLSPGSENERRDRVAKLGLYSRRGAVEYWIVSLPARSIEVFRRAGERLTLAATLREGDEIESPLLPGFGLSVSNIFSKVPVDAP
jgi:Uma2 family endonuclease